MGLTVVITFSLFVMTGCGACEIVKPVIEQLKKDFEREHRVEFKTHNTSDDNWREASTLGVASVPTVQLYMGGELLEFAEGPMPKSAYSQMLRRHLSKFEETRMHVDNRKATK